MIRYGNTINGIFDAIRSFKLTFHLNFFLNLCLVAISFTLLGCVSTDYSQDDYNLGRVPPRPEVAAVTGLVPGLPQLINQDYLKSGLIASSVYLPLYITLNAEKLIKEGNAKNGIIQNPSEFQNTVTVNKTIFLITSLAAAVYGYMDGLDRSTIRYSQYTSILNGEEMARIQAEFKAKQDAEARARQLVLYEEQERQRKQKEAEEAEAHEREKVAFALRVAKWEKEISLRQSQGKPWLILLASDEMSEDFLKCKSGLVNLSGKKLDFFFLELTSPNGEVSYCQIEEVPVAGTDLTAVAPLYFSQFSPDSKTAPQYVKAVYAGGKVIEANSPEWADTFYVLGAEDE